MLLVYFSFMLEHFFTPFGVLLWVGVKVSKDLSVLNVAEVLSWPADLQDAYNLIGSLLACNVSLILGWPSDICVLLMRHKNYANEKWWTLLWPTKKLYGHLMHLILISVSFHMPIRDHWNGWQISIHYSGIIINC